jgi:single-strand DNA-binding protein
VELKKLESGKSVVNFSIAVNDGRETPTWVDIVAWDKTAELCARLGKGEMVGIVGRIQVRDFETKAGEKRKAVEIVADRMEFLGGGGKKPEPVEAPNASSDLDVPF